MRHRPAYYIVFGLRDGTVVSALQTRKPTKKSLRHRERIDADGIYRWHTTEATNFSQSGDREVIINHVAISGRLNTRRAIRELVEPRLEAIEQRLERIETALVQINDHARETTGSVGH